MSNSTSADEKDPSASTVQESIGTKVIPLATAVFVFIPIFIIGFSGRHTPEQLINSMADGPVYQMVFVVMGLGMCYLQFIEGKASNAVAVLRIAAAPLAAATVASIIYLSATRDERPLRNSISAYYHSSASLLFIVAGVSLGYLLATEATAQNRIVIRGREFELYAITDGVRIISAIAACVLALIPTATEGGDLHSDSSVLHGYASLVLFLGLTFQVVSYYLEIRTRPSSVCRLIHLLCGWGMSIAVLLCIAVIAFKIGESVLLWLEIAALLFYFASFTTRNYPRAVAGWRKLTKDFGARYCVLASRFDR